MYVGFLLRAAPSRALLQYLSSKQGRLRAQQTQCPHGTVLSTCVRASRAGTHPSKAVSWHGTRHKLCMSTFSLATMSSIRQAGLLKRYAAAGGACKLPTHAVNKVLAAINTRNTEWFRPRPYALQGGEVMVTPRNSGVTQPSIIYVSNSTW